MDEAVISTLKWAYVNAAPEAMLVITACVLFLGSTVKGNRHVWGWVALAGITAAGLAACYCPAPADQLRGVAPLFHDGLAFYTRVVGLTVGGLLVLSSWDELPDDQAADYFACLLVLTAGVGLVGAANELITLFLALEMVSIPTYIMLYLPKTGRPVQEAAVKYFLLSVFASGLFLFGLSYLYGATGTTNLTAIHAAFDSTKADAVPGLMFAAACLVIAGLGFRITAVPFHFYAPDVYQGAPTAVAGLLAVVPKLAGVVALIRILGLAGQSGPTDGLSASPQMPQLLWLLAAVTMTLGNVVALWQDNLKRLLAYSGIAHAGYMLLGLAAAPVIVGPGPGGVAAVLFYLVAYAAMTLGAFAILSRVSNRDRPVETIDDITGLSRTHPGEALLMALFLFSLIGLPLTAGFAGKLLLFFGAMATPADEPMFRWLALVAALNAAIGAYYYLRLVAAMYLRGALYPLPAARSAGSLVTAWACAGVTLWLGCFPKPLAELANAAAAPPAGLMQARR